jgi:MHS family proline/betaine transporter-like MFS transporter
VKSTKPASAARTVTAAAIGSGFEIYDFTLFAFFAVSIAPAFFPAADKATSLLLTVATFGIGAIMRPIGAVVLGLYADRIGRKSVLSATVLMMGAGSVAIGLIPSYASIGMWAPILVVLARMMQGLSAGGELGTAMTLVSEQAPVHRRGLYTSLVSAASLGGTLFSAGLGLLLQYLLGPESMAEWGWRIPFLIGGLIAPVGFYIRARLPESKLFVEVKAIASHTVVPHVKVRLLLCLIAGVIPGTVVNYLTLIYMPTYLHQYLNVSLNVSFQAVMLGAIVVAILSPLGGMLSDRMDRRRLILCGNLALLVSSYPLYRALGMSTPFGTLLGVLCGFGVLLTLVIVPMVPLAAELLPTIGRSTGMSLTLALPIALFGSCSPLIVSALILWTGNPLAPAFYVMSAALVGVIGVALLPIRPIAKL